MSQIVCKITFPQILSVNTPYIVLKLCKLQKTVTYFIKTHMRIDALIYKMFKYTISSRICYLKYFNCKKLQLLNPHIPIWNLQERILQISICELSFVKLAIACIHLSFTFQNLVYLGQRTL